MSGLEEQQETDMNLLYMTKFPQTEIKKQFDANYKLLFMKCVYFYLVKIRPQNLHTYFKEEVYF